MCIKLIRHFECSIMVEHTREYLARCSNPTYLIEDLVGSLPGPGGLGRRPCLDEGTLETREEWYKQACPDCTGENEAPKEGCSGVIEHNIPGRGDDRRYEYFSNAHLVPYDDAVNVYAHNLAYWLLANIYSPDRSRIRNSTLWSGPMGTYSDISVWQERNTYIMNELLCQVDPGHGFLCRLAVDESIPDEESTEFGLQLPHEGCPCPSTQKPWLCNWALHIRREAARDIYLQLMDMSNGILDEANYKLQQEVINHCGNISKLTAANAIADKGPSAPEALPVLEIQHPLGDALVDRGWVLGWDAGVMAELFACRVLDEDDEPLGSARHVSRASLLPWAVFILMHDSGLTLRRAREILALFASKVVRHYPDWRDFRPQLLTGYDACERLAAVASLRPLYIPDWVNKTLGPLLNITDFNTKTRIKYTLWQKQDRGRVNSVWANVVTATDAQFQALRESGDTRCPICLEEFDDHDSALPKNPVQNWHCYCRGNKHWINMTCLTKFARTLYNLADEDAAPPPRCPICRTTFEDSESESDETEFDSDEVF
ncbi:predicted protein [Chaetomium globosum CBS 148.51]|uniref:Uncharacterized protein n=1 Tax=Chaetomium globosum (strain ATCC 6205 / CBS 148.51 / DSM 1962 / NBRC 6347 / NRRL 1970) TaxID=306901 RepID=Q2HF69_CHAGB|nr:uncharacterized protein CHGG_01135 [Chaetomium globosum CBS 148.51]EAQ92900.1 predicted protein [Chaetomium globosum CBS 148.51]